MKPNHRSMCICSGRAILAAARREVVASSLRDALARLAKLCGRSNTNQQVTEARRPVYIQPIRPGRFLTNRCKAVSFLKLALQGLLAKFLEPVKPRRNEITELRGANPENGCEREKWEKRGKFSALFPSPSPFSLPLPAPGNAPPLCFPTLQRGGQGGWWSPPTEAARPLSLRPTPRSAHCIRHDRRECVEALRPICKNTTSCRRVAVSVAAV